MEAGLHLCAETFILLRIDLRVESSVVMYMSVSRVEVTSLGDASRSRVGWARYCASLEMCQ